MSKRFSDYVLDHVLDELDVAKIASVMKFLDWKWASVTCEDGVPTQGDIRRKARDLLQRMQPLTCRGYSSVGSGGLQASVSCDDEGFVKFVKLSFVLDWSEMEIEGVEA